MDIFNNIQPLPPEISDLLNYLKQDFKNIKYEKNIFESYFCKFIKYLEVDLKSKYRRIKNYSNDFIAGQIFKIQYKTKSIKTHYKYQYFALLQSIKRIDISMYNNKNIKNESLVIMLSQLKEIVIETIIFLDTINSIFDKHFSSYGFGKRNVLSSEELWALAKMLSHNTIDFGVVGDFAIRPTSISLIRQAIELRILNALGIKSIKDNDGKLIKIVGTNFTDFITEARNNIQFPVKTSNLLHIYNWCSHYTHTGIISELYQIDWALYIINPLFQHKLIGKVWSRYGAITIKKSFYDRIEETVKEFICKKDSSKDKNLLSVDISHNPECILID